MEFELRHLRAVCAIASAGSITRAAALLHTTQPALTAQLKRIERSIGGPLFRRGQQGVLLTPLGEYVVGRARIVLSAADDLRRGIAARRAPTPGGPLRLGGTAGPVVIGLAERLTRELPGTEVSVRTEPAPLLLVDLIAAGQLDAAVLVDYPDWEINPPAGVTLYPLVDEPVFVALAANHRLAGNAEIELAALADETWVLGPPDGAGWPECFEAACAGVGFAPRVTHRTAELRPIHELVASGRALSPCQATFSPTPGMVVRPFVGDPVWLRHLLARPRGGVLEIHADLLVEWAMTVYHAAAERSPQLRAWRARRREHALSGSV